MAECRYGMTTREVVATVSDVVHFIKWVKYRPVSACTGKVFHSTINNYIPDDCGPHGIIYNPDDVSEYCSNYQNPSKILGLSDR